MSRLSIEWLFIFGLCGMFVALVFQTVSLTRRELYPFVLCLALGLMVFADRCLIIIVRRGPIPWRLAGVIVMLPTIFILLDFMRRAPYFYFLE